MRVWSIDSKVGIHCRYIILYWLILLFFSLLFLYFTLLYSTLLLYIGMYALTGKQREG